MTVRVFPSGYGFSLPEGTPDTEHRCFTLLNRNPPLLKRGGFLCSRRATFTFDSVKSNMELHLTNVIIHSLRSLSRIYALMLFPSASALAFVSVFCCSPLPLCCHLLHSPFCGGFAPDLVHLVRSMSTKLRKFRNASGTVSRNTSVLKVRVSRLRR